MNRALADAASLLADTLARENQALAALDLARAVGLLEEKQRATSAFATAHAALAAAGLSEAERTVLAEQIGARLRTLATDNKRLLERAMEVQRRVVGTLAQAAPAAIARAPRYNARGGMALGAATAVALSTRA
jgi:hypothetical protein